MSTRELVLGRVRAAIAGAAAAPAAPRTYRSAGTADDDARVALFCERVGEYRADVRRIAAGGEAAEIRAVCDSLGARRLVVPGGLSAALRPAGVDLVEDTGLDPHSARRRRRRPDGQHRRDRRNRDDRAHRRARRGPPRDHARPRPAHLPRRGERDRRARPRGDRAPGGRRPPSAVPSRSSRGPPRPPTSSSAGSRASTARGRSSSSSSARIATWPGTRPCARAPRAGWPPSSRS